MNKPNAYEELPEEKREVIDEIQSEFSESLASRLAPDLDLHLKGTTGIFRKALLHQLLEVRIDHWKKDNDYPPTLYELQKEFLPLENEIADVYPTLHRELRLPVKLGTILLKTIKYRGGQGWTAQGLDDKTLDVRAVKFVDYKREPNLARWLKHESEILQRLSASNIVAFRGFGKDDCYAYLITQYYDGPNLQDTKLRSFSSHDIAVIGERLADAIEHIHSKSIVHGDIKPANVLLQHQDAPVLLDFGTAIDISNGMLPMEERRRFHGTPAFKAPEQLAEDGTVDGRLSDIFSLGGTLGWLLTEQEPGPDPEDHDAFRKAVDQIDCSKPLKEIILKATARDPSERFRSATEIVAALCRERQSQERKQSWQRPVWVMLLASAMAIAMYVTYRRSQQASQNLPTANLVEQLDRIAKRQDALEEGPSELEKIAAAQSIDLESISEDDFEVSFDLKPDPSGEKLTGGGRIILDVNPELVDIGSWLEFRIGDAVWKQIFQDDVQTGLHFGLLFPEDINSSGPVQVRINDLVHRGKRIIGPFSYEIDIQDELRRTVALRHSEFSSFVQNLDWLVFDNQRIAWALNREIDKQYIPYIRQLRLGRNKDDLTASVPFDKLLNQHSISAYPVGFRRVHNWSHAQENLEIVLRSKIEPSDSVFLQMVYWNGSQSKVRVFVKPLRFREPKLTDAERTEIAEQPFVFDGRKWTFRQPFLNSFHSLVTEIRVGVDPDALDCIVPMDRYSGQSRDDQSAKKHFVAKTASFMQNLSFVPIKTRMSTSFAWQIVFIDGTVSEVREATAQ